MLTRAKFLRLSGLTAAALVISPEAMPKSNDGIVRVKSSYNFQETITRLKNDIAAKGIRFFSEIDQTELAARSRHQAQSFHAAGVWQSATRHPVHDGKPERRSGLARTAPGDPGQRWRGLDGLHRLCLDRRASRHRQS